MADEMTPLFEGFAPKPAETLEAGPVEIGIGVQIEKLTADGWITGHHAGQVALAVRAARDVDQSQGKGAPSGRANLLRVMKEILEMLPQPEQQTSGALDKALEAIMSGDS